MTLEPKRLSEGGDALSLAIGAARRRLPGRDHLDAVAAGLARAGVVVSSPAPSGPPLAPAKVGLGAKWALLASGVVGASLLATAFLWSSRADQPTPPAAPRAAELATPRAAVEPKSDLVAPGAGSRAPESFAPPEPPSRDPASTAVSPGDVRPVERPASSARRPAVDEVELLKQARNSLASRPAETLALVERARAEFPESALRQEREFLTISALFRLGRSAEARRRDQAFRARYPRSAYLPQLDRLTDAR